MQTPPADPPLRAEENVPEWVHKGRVPCLDGMRALAIVGVLLDHLVPHMADPLKPGHRGVVLFFVISGFLITLLMLREENRTGTVSLADFYRRRTFRIMPALLFYLLVVFVLQSLGLLVVTKPFWIAALTYTTCYLPFAGHWDVSWDVIHTWSLSVEEHFYLLWPLLYCVLKPRNAFKVLLGYLILLPLIRWSTERYFGQHIDITYASITQMGNIAVGCVLAYMVQGRAFVKLHNAVKRHPFLFFAGGMVLVALPLLGFVHTKASVVAQRLLGDPASALGMACIVLAVVYAKNSFLFRVLNWRPLVYIGTLSYSIYLWQQLFTFNGAFASRPGFWGHWTITLLLIAVASLVSYYGIEVPFLSIKTRQPLKKLSTAR